MKYAASTMTHTETPADAGEAHSLVEDLIYSQVHKFHRCYGGDFEQLKSDADYRFLLGHKKFKTGKRPSGAEYTDFFATEVCRWVWYGLLDDMRICIERDKKTKFYSTDALQDGDDKSYDPEGQREFNLEEFLADLSIPAQLAARLLFEDSPEVDGPAMAKGGSATKWRSAIRNEMIAQGYTRARINEAFLEIEEALQSC
jgi:hypothetical protein